MSTGPQPRTAAANAARRAAAEAKVQRVRDAIAQLRRRKQASGRGAGGGRRRGQEPATHVTAGTGRTQTCSYVSGISQTSSTSSLTTCDLVSQQSAPAAPVTELRCAAETPAGTGRSRPVPRPTANPHRLPDQRIPPGRMTWTTFSARTGRAGRDRGGVRRGRGLARVAWAGRVAVRLVGERREADRGQPRLAFPGGRQTAFHASCPIGTAMNGGVAFVSDYNSSGLVDEPLTGYPEGHPRGRSAAARDLCPPSLGRRPPRWGPKPLPGRAPGAVDSPCVRQRRGVAGCQFPCRPGQADGPDPRRLAEQCLGTGLQRRDHRPGQARPGAFPGPEGNRRIRPACTAVGSSRAGRRIVPGPGCRHHADCCREALHHGDADRSIPAVAGLRARPGDLAAGCHGNDPGLPLPGHRGHRPPSQGRRTSD